MKNISCASPYREDVIFFSDFTMWPTYEISASCGETLKKGFTFCFHLILSGSNPVIVKFLSEESSDITIFLNSDNYIFQKDKFVDIQIYYKSEEPVINSTSQVNVGWNRFCLELNATKREIKFLVNNERLFQNKEEPFHAIEVFNKIQILGKFLLSKAEVFSVEIEDIRPSMSGNILKWNASDWGTFESYHQKDVSNLSVFQPTLIYIPNIVLTFPQTLQTCQKIGMGEIIGIYDHSHQNDLLQLYSAYNISLPRLYFPYIKNINDNNYSHFYTKNPMEININNVPDPSCNEYNCINCDFETHLCYATPCTARDSFFCNFSTLPILHLRGLCSQSKMEQYFFPSTKLGEYVWIGINSGYIRFNKSLKLWILKMAYSDVWASSDASFGMS